MIGFAHYRLDACRGVFQDVEEFTPTDIKPSANMDNHTSVIYNLDGRRLNAKPQKGIYIQNGKKVVK